MKTTKILKVFAVATTLLALTACETTIDGTSDETIRQSVKAMADEGLAHPGKLSAALSTIKTNNRDDEEKFYEAVDGLTAEELLAEHERLQQLWAEKRAERVAEMDRRSAEIEARLAEERAKPQAERDAANAAWEAEQAARRKENQQ